MSYNSILQSKNADIQELIDIANSLPDVAEGIELPELAQPATSGEIFLNKETIDQEGNILVGTFTISEELNEQNTLLTTLQSALASKGAGDISMIQNDYLAAVANKELSEIVNHKMTGKLYESFQHSNKNLTKVDLPLITSMGSGSFNQCNKLVDVNLPMVTEMGASNFEACHGLQKLYFPSLEKMTGWGYTFNVCSGLAKVWLPVIKEISAPNGFVSCGRLLTMIIGTNTVCTLSNTNVFNNTPISGNTDMTNGELGYIYVPKALIEDYKVATNWAAYANQFRAIEDYPNITEGFE